MSTILLLGAYGQNNLGDDALLEIFLHELRDHNLIVNSAQPDQTSKRYGVLAVPTYGRWPHVPQILALLKADLIVFGGGSLLKETEGSLLDRIQYFVRIFVVLLFAKLCRRKTAMLGVGIGPLQHPFYCWLSRMAAELTDLICVRDVASRTLLSMIGVKKLVHVTADPVFLLPPDHQAQLADAHDTQPTIIVVPRYSLDEAQQRALAVECNQLIARHHVRIQIMVFQTDYQLRFDDYRVALAIQNGIEHTDSVELVQPRTPAEALALIAASRMVVSTRLHGLIFACIQHVPAIAIDYEVKVQSFMSEIEQSWASVSLAELVEGRLTSVIEQAWRTNSVINAQMVFQHNRLQQDARKNYILLHSEILNHTQKPDQPHPKVSQRQARWWRSLLIAGISLILGGMLWRVAHAEAPSVSHPAQQSITLIMPALVDSEAEQASGAYIPGVGAVFTMQLVRGPNTIAEKPSYLGVRDWMTHLMLTFGTQLVAIPPDEQIAMSTEYYNYEDTVYHQVVITVRAADVADTSKYLFWLDGLPFDQAVLNIQAAQLQSSLPEETPPAP